MPLHIDSRPKTFNEVIGNSSAISSLQSSLKRKDRPHVFLFSGPAGCGKTTLARIVAGELGCHPSDLQEINSSNNRGIDTAREIISNMHYKPLNGSVRVYLLDEVHKTTNDFQNALLKALEDTPNHVYFLLCTTDPNKLIKAVKSRCSTYPVTPLSASQMGELLKRVAGENKIKVNAEIIKEIASTTDNARQALIILDQVRDADEKDIPKIIREGQVEEKQVIDLCRRLLHPKSSWQSIAPILKGITAEPESVRRAVLGYMTSVLLNEDNSRAALCIDCFKDHFYDSGKAGLVGACYSVVSE